MHHAYCIDLHVVGRWESEREGGVKRRKEGGGEEERKEDGYIHVHLL